MSGIVKIGVITLVVLAGVGFFVWRKTTPDKLPNTSESVTHWLCDKCGNHVELTASQVAQWCNDGKHIDRRGGGRQQMRFLCEKCGTFTLSRATECPEHKIWFAAVDSNDQPQQCPQCAKKPRT